MPSSQTTNKAADTSVRNSDAGSKEENRIPPAVVPTGTSEEKQVAADSLGDVGSKVQQEIGEMTVCCNDGDGTRTLPPRLQRVAPAGANHKHGFHGEAFRPNLDINPSIVAILYIRMNTGQTHLPVFYKRVGGRITSGDEPNSNGLSRWPANSAKFIFFSKTARAMPRYVIDVTASF
ncbi:hypothetical protein Tco_0429582 [Tanacetum coccineum]